MNWQKLDFWFPFLVFFYGILMVIVLEVPFFKNLAMQRNVSLPVSWQNRGPLAWMCLFCGGIWSLQNLWF